MGVFNVVENGFMPIYQKRDSDQFYNPLFMKIRSLRLSTLGWTLGLILLCMYVLPGLIYAIWVFIKKKNFAKEEACKIIPPFEVGRHISFY